MTTTYRITEVAERTGTSPGTLRYYERIGVLPVPARAANGYRVYDDRTLERLGFVTRAKQLGCSLEEIADLTVAWEGGECGPLQVRLRELVAEKEASARAESAALATLAGELRDAATALDRHRPDGPCDERCGCVTSPPTASDATAAAAEGIPDEIAVACTLGVGAIAERLADWRALVSPAPSALWSVERTEIPSGLRLTFRGDVDIAEVVRLATAEQDCCRFFAFAVTIDHRGLALDVTAPADGLASLHELFGAPAEVEVASTT